MGRVLGVQRTRGMHRVPWVHGISRMKRCTRGGGAARGAWDGCKDTRGTCGAQDTREAVEHTGWKGCVGYPGTGTRDRQDV